MVQLIGTDGFFFIYVLWNISMESTKGNLRANKLIVDKLQLTTQWSTSQRWKQRIKALSRGSEKKLLTVASISNVSSSSFQLTLCNNYTHETPHVNSTNQSIILALNILLEPVGQTQPGYATIGKLEPYW